jgi:hypothetical protein
MALVVAWRPLITLFDVVWRFYVAFVCWVKSSATPVDTRDPGVEGAGMSWERALLELFDDLEQQAEGLARWL